MKGRLSWNYRVIMVTAIIVNKYRAFCSITAVCDEAKLRIKFRAALAIHILWVSDLHDRSHTLSGSDRVGGNCVAPSAILSISGSLLLYVSIELLICHDFSPFKHFGQLSMSLSDDVIATLLSNLIVKLICAIWESF